MTRKFQDLPRYWGPSLQAFPYPSQTTASSSHCCGNWWSMPGSPHLITSAKYHTLSIDDSHESWSLCCNMCFFFDSQSINKTSHFKQVLMNYELYQLQAHLFCQSLKSAPGDSCQYSKATWRPARSSGKLVHMSQIVCAYTNLSLIGKLLHAQDEQSIATSPNFWYTWRPSESWNYPCLKKKVFKQFFEKCTRPPGPHQLHKLHPGLLLVAQKLLSADLAGLTWAKQKCKTWTSRPLMRLKHAKASFLSTSPSCSGLQWLQYIMMTTSKQIWWQKMVSNFACHWIHTSSAPAAISPIWETAPQPKRDVMGMEMQQKCLLYSNCRFITSQQVLIPLTLHPH